MSNFNNQAFNPFNKPMNLVFQRFVISQTGTYDAQFLRPYQTQMTGQVLQNVLQQVDKSISTGNTNVALDDETISNMITMSPVPGSEIVIPNGWMTPRLKFSLIVSVDFSVGGKQIITIQGYSEYSDLSFSGRFDPNMKFFINSIKVNQLTTGANTFGNEFCASSNHVMADNNFTVGSSPLLTMRPQDVFYTMQHSHIANIPEVLEPMGGLIDSRLCLRRSPIANTVENNNPYSFTNAILSGSIAGAMSSIGENNDAELLSKCSASVIENTINYNPFMQAVMGQNRNSLNNFFTMKDLISIDPNVDKIMMFVQHGPNELHELNQVGQTASWYSTDRISHAANYVIRAVSSILYSNDLSSAQIVMSNFSKSHAIALLGAEMCRYSPMDERRYFSVCETVKQRIVKEVLPIISYGGGVPYAITINYNQYGDTKITINLENSGDYVFVTPSFADSMMSPVITNDTNTLYGVANDFSLLVNNIKDSFQDRQVMATW